ncbi:MAG: aromatic amino acid lyase, partial [Flavobacteriaceae bacterium]
MSKIGIPALKIEEFHEILQTPSRLALSGAVIDKIEKSHQRVRKMAQDSKAIYGINTGFGPLCQTKIAVQDTAQLQRNLLLSHAVGVGNPVAKKLSKIMLLLKIHALAQGYSGISLAVLERLIYFFKNDLIPVVP